MIKVPITYIDFEGNEVKEDIYFNLTKGEIASIHLSLPGGIDGFLSKIGTNPDWSDIEDVYKKIILTAYGKRTVGNKFIKSKELSAEFAATDAYSEIFLKFLANDNDFVNKFIEQVVNVSPGEMKKILAEAENKRPEVAELSLVKGEDVPVV